ncbi:MAG: TlpA disulfide reductase family protein, partial [Agathobaculum sp.]|uniref:TlpA disulfide reductase family protein n=1 Tax=Agathobaculum sp. TaxID=2048138 RepID=UPI003D9175E5
MKRFALSAVMACLLLALCACGAPEAPKTPAAPDDTASGSTDAPAENAGILSAFTADTLDGEQVDQTLFAEDTLTMVNVWGTSCGPCISEMPDLAELAEEYEDKNVRIIGLVADVLDSDGQFSETQLETARDVVASTGADYVHLLPSPDLQGLLAQISSLPTTFFVNSAGAQVGTAYLGAKDKEDW